MFVWRVEYVELSDMNRKYAIYVDAYEAHMAKLLAFNQITGTAYETNQRAIIFTSITEYGEY